MALSDSDYRSVTLWLNELKEGSDDAASQLWRRYFERLVLLAKQRLGKAPKRIADEEDIAINVFRSLCDGIENGRFDQLDDRDDLWKLLVVMTRHKAMNQMRHQTAKKRGGRDVKGHSIFERKALVDSNVADFDVFFSDDPTPEFLVEVQEEQDRLLNLLADDSHRDIAKLRLQGFSVDETAKQIGISSRSVKRKLALIREAWIVEFQERGRVQK